MSYLNYIGSLLTMFVVLLDARLISRVDEVPPKDQTDMYNCYLRYVSEPLDRHVAILILTNDNVAEYIQHIQSARTVTNIWRMKHDKREEDFSAGLVIVVVTETKILGQIFTMLAWLPTANVRTRYLIVYLGVEPTDLIFELAWRRYIVNIVVLRQGDSRVHTYFPYGHGECGERIRSEVLGQCQQLSLAALYPAKVPQVFHGCAFRTTSYVAIPSVIDPRANTGDPKIDGFENVLVHSIVERLNLSIRLNVSGFKEIYTNGIREHWSPMTNLVLNISDMVFSSLRRTYGFGELFEASYVFEIDTMVWHAPLARPGAQWMSVILVFQGSMWYAVLGFFLINTFVWWIFDRTTTCWHGSYLECLLGSWLVLLNGSVPFPRRTVMRFLVTSWTVCSLLVIAAYQCQFLSFLLKPVYEKQITNEREIVESGVPVIVWTLQENILNDIHDQYSEEILKRAQVYDMDAYTGYVLYGKKEAVFMHDLMSTKYYAMYSFNNTNSRPTVYSFKEPILFIPFCMYFRKGHPLLDRWNQLLMQFVESGMLDKLKSAVDNTPPDIPEDPEKVPINLLQLSSAFYILLFGYAAALLAFLFELIVHRIERKSQSRVRRQR